MKSLVLTIPFFLITLHSATAELVRIEPDLFDEGADLTAANPYVELRVADESNVPYALFTVTANDSGEKATPTGSKLFGHSNIGFWPSTRRFYAKFDFPTDFVSIQFTGGSSLSKEKGILIAYDENNNVLDSVYSEFVYNGEYSTMKIPRTTADISYIIAYTKDGSFGILDDFRFDANPEIEVADSGDNVLTSGAGLVSYGNSTLGEAVSQTFTIRNVGPGTLSGLSLSTGGLHDDDFIPHSIGSTSTIAPGGSLSITVDFIPSRQGVRTGTLRIASNDEDEAPFEIPLTGVGDFHATQEIAVQDPNGLFIEDGEASLVFNAAVIGTSLQKTITVHNFGQLPLTDLAVSVSGTNAADFSCSAPLATSLAAGESTTFTVTFGPTAVGALNATVHIASNDADENTFDLSVNGTGQPVPAPEISVIEDSLGILTDGSSTLAYGPVVVGNVITKTIVIRNTGTANLTNLALTLSGAGAAHYVVPSWIPKTVAPLANIKVVVSFKPSTTGSKNAILRIASNDTDENPFDISLSGSGITLPEIAVRQGWGYEARLEDNESMRHFGEIRVGNMSKAMTFVVRNVGNAPLRNVSLSMLGVNPGDFKILAKPESTVPVGGSTKFKIAFKPKSAGTRKAMLRILSNDADENPFRIQLKGTGL